MNYGIGDRAYTRTIQGEEWVLGHGAILQVDEERCSSWLDRDEERCT